jgi:predicted RNase H-like HicB family nuclease
MKTYTFKVVVEPDDDRWHAYCPALEGKGGSTWGYTREEALKHINEVVQLVVESMIEHGERLPDESTEEVQVTIDPRVTVNV